MDNINKHTEKFGKDMVKLARKNIIQYKIETTGKLRKSLGYKLDNGIDFFMNDYGVLRDAGQLGKKRKILKGWNKSIFVPRGKGFTDQKPPFVAIRKWVQDKPIRATGISTSQLAGAIQYKIWQRGITPGLFFSDAWNKLWPIYLDKFETELGKDIEEKLEDK